MRRVLVAVLFLVFLAGGIYFLITRNTNQQPTWTTVSVQRGRITVEALAVGTIEPEEEVVVKSIVPGIVQKIYFKVGDTVHAGDTLMALLPNPTPLEFATARREMEMARVEFDRATRSLDRQRRLYASHLISRDRLEESEKQYRMAELRYRMAREKFLLMQRGTVDFGDQKVETTIRAPVSGTVLEIKVHEGDPVVPLTSYQPGTELCVIADMHRLVFKGTVDEIDVGKIDVGHRAIIEIGALPDHRVTGIVRRIAPKARKNGNASVFDIEIGIDQTEGKLLRAGYSATAHIIVAEKDDVLLIPERLVHFEDDGTAWVEVLDGTEIRKRTVRLGLSDGLNVEVVQGLREGEQVIERSANTQTE